MKGWVEAPDRKNRDRHENPQDVNSSDAAKRAGDDAISVQAILTICPIRRNYKILLCLLPKQPGGLEKGSGVVTPPCCTTCTVCVGVPGQNCFAVLRSIFVRASRPCRTICDPHGDGLASASRCGVARFLLRANAFFASAHRRKSLQWPADRSGCRSDPPQRSSFRLQAT